MMNSSCIAGCLDVQSPVEKRSVRLYQWAQGDKEFLRLLLSMNKETEQNASSTASSAISTTPSSSPTPSPARLVPTGCCDQNYACRQRYLRSYTFTKKQTAGQRTKKWLQQKHGLKAKNSSATRTCSFLDAVFKLLFVCVAKVDVHEI